MTDVQQTLGATIAPHSTLVVALRQAVTWPLIIGSTRHIVQGAIDTATSTGTRRRARSARSP